MHKDVCCFIGGECKERIYNDVKNRMRKEVQKAIIEGYSYFITGLMTEIDIIGAEVVLDEKQKGSNVKLICYPKYKDFEKSILDDKKRAAIENILHNADKVVYFYPKRFDACSNVGTIIICSSSRAIGVLDVISRQMYNVLECGIKKGIEFVDIKKQ